MSFTRDNPPPGKTVMEWIWDTSRDKLETMRFVFTGTVSTDVEISEEAQAKYDLKSLLSRRDDYFEPHPTGAWIFSSINDCMRLGTPNELSQRL